MMASWTPTPGAAFAPLGGEALSNEVGCGGEAAEKPLLPDTCDGNSLLFEAYTPGEAFDWRSLADIGETVFEERWNGWDPIVQHRELEFDIWYSNDDAFKNEIPEFGEADNFVMRWR